MKKSFRGISTTLLIFAGLFLFTFATYIVVNQGQRGYRSVKNTSNVYTYTGAVIYNDSKIEERGICRRVKENTCTNDVFIPTKTTGERSGFIDNAPSCITLYPCLAEIDRKGDLFNRENDKCYSSTGALFYKQIYELGSIEQDSTDVYNELRCVDTDNSILPRPDKDHWVNFVWYPGNGYEYSGYYGEIEPEIIYENYPLCYGGYRNLDADDHGESNCTDGIYSTTEGDVY